MMKVFQVRVLHEDGKDDGSKSEGKPLEEGV